MDLAYGYEGPPLGFPLLFSFDLKQSLLSHHSNGVVELFVWIQS